LYSLIKKIGLISYVLLGFLGAIISIAYFCYDYFVKDTTLGVNYIDNQVGLDIIKASDLSEDEIARLEDRYFLQANFYSNSKNNGTVLQELCLNYFSDYTLESSAYRSTGMQILRDLEQEDITYSTTTKSEANEHQDGAFSYYDTTNGVSWSGNKLTTPLNRNNSFIVKIDGQPYSIQLDGTYSYKSTKKVLWFKKNVTTTIYYNYLNVFVDCMEAIRSNSVGFGDYYIVVDLSRYFTVKEYDVETGKFKTDDVTDIIKNYSVLKFHYDENGAINSSQSMFGAIDCNPSYYFYDTTDTTYWQERILYTLDYDSKINGQKVFEYRYSDSYKGYFVSLNLDARKIFATMPRAKVNLYFDLSNVCDGINIVGLDYNAFEDFNINKITLIGDDQSFYMLNKSLYNTQLNIFEHSSNLNIEYLDDAVNNEFVEVIL